MLREAPPINHSALVAVTVQIAVEVMENVQGAVTKVAAAVEGAMVQVKRADHAEGDAHVSESKGGVSETTAPANSS